jgi:hypothetical protein
VNHRVYGVNRPFPTMDEPFISKHSQVQDDVIHVGVADHARDGVMFGTFVAGTLHQPYLRVGIVDHHHCSPWECIAISRGWAVVWIAEDSTRELTPSRISFDSLSLPYLIRSQVSVILTDVRLPGPSSFWWASTSPLLWLLVSDYPTGGHIILRLGTIIESPGHMPPAVVFQQTQGLVM